MPFFGPKQRSPKKCKNCKNQVQFGPYNDIASCICGEQFLTGYESELRTIIESNYAGTPFPPFAVGRAIGYASEIYGMATHDESFNGAKIEKFLKDKSDVFTGASTGEVELVFEGSRGLRRRGLNDPRAGYLIIVVTADRRARNRNKDFQHIYVVFRGSRSDQGETLNPMMAGFSGSAETGFSNVDYAANFTGRQDTPWWCANAKIRRGFLELYRSMSIDISLEVKAQLTRYPKARVIVTGHSLGAALAVVCAHHLQYLYGKIIDGGGPFCYPFCTPRVGDLGFARDFKARLGDSYVSMPGEDSGQLYNRSLNFCMNNDPVSTDGAYGYKHDRSDNPTSQGTPAANKSFAGKIFYAKTKTLNKEIIFYQTPNVYKVGWQWLWNIHQYSKMQEIILGDALFTR
ncbi:MAG TPA: lipase family protein [Candidatus Limnocylindrales bacterium]|nr:lipase family protein [Candidatus Limnocylindrales bacterium]